MKRRSAARIALALAVGLALAGLGLALAMPHVTRLDAASARLRQVAEHVLGHAVRYDALALGLFPLRLVVERPVVSARASDAKLLEAERAVLVLALAPLLGGAVPVESVRVEAARLRLLRSPEGFELPPLAFPRLTLKNARVAFDDLAVDPAVHWILEAVDLETRGGEADAPLILEASGRLVSGGSFRLTGNLTRDGNVDLALHLDGVALEPAAPYLGMDSRLAGRATGVITVSGAAAAPDRVEAELRVRDAALRLGDIVLGGGFELRLELTRDPSGLRGAFEVAASEARFVYAEGVAQARGDAAIVTGRLVPRPGGALGVEDLRLKVRNPKATGRVRSERPGGSRRGARAQERSRA